MKALIHVLTSKDALFWQYAFSRFISGTTPWFSQRDDEMIERFTNWEVTTLARKVCVDEDERILTLLDRFLNGLEFLEPEQSVVLASLDECETIGDVARMRTQKKDFETGERKLLVA